MAEVNVSVETDHGPLLFWASDTIGFDDVEAAVRRMVEHKYPGAVVESLTFGDPVKE